MQGGRENHNFPRQGRVVFGAARRGFGGQKYFLKKVVLGEPRLVSFYNTEVLLGTRSTSGSRSTSGNPEVLLVLIIFNSKFTDF